ncbi:MAG TPA: transcriptional regulator [Tepidisphaeraceae bacterium]|nr:transcriptional regulator [Tepidisphaeraceae bacterium]
MPRRERDPKSTTGRFAYDGLERVIHERARLSILSSLAAHPEGLLFTELRTLCALTDGNLSRQLTQLQDGRFVETWKGTRNNRPQTLVKLTESGRKRFLEYIGVLEGLVADALSSTRTSTADASAARARLSAT